MPKVKFTLDGTKGLIQELIDDENAVSELIANLDQSVYATKEYVDTAVSSSGGGSGSFATLTSNEFTGNQKIIGTLEVQSNSMLKDTTILGNLSTINLSVSSNTISNLIPSTHNTFDLGSSPNRYRNIFGNNIVGNNIVGSTISTAASTLSSTGLTVGGSISTISSTTTNFTRNINFSPTGGSSSITFSSTTTSSFNGRTVFNSGSTIFNNNPTFTNGITGSITGTIAQFSQLTSSLANIDNINVLTASFIAENPSHWDISSPTTIQQAINRLAAAYFNISGAIPL